MLILGNNWPQHRSWCGSVLITAIVAGAWYLLASYGQPSWPGGSSFPGFTFGVLGGLICLFEFLLFLRKKVRVWRIGRAQTWMRAHIWLGLLAVPLLVLHSGFRFGGPLTTTLMVLLLVVVASGIWGLIFQHLMPRKLLHDVPAETIYSQIDLMSRQLRQEASYVVRITCGSEGAYQDHQDDLVEVDGPLMTVGAVRAVGRVNGKMIEARLPTVAVEDAETLRYFFEGNVGPFLDKGSSSRSPLRNPERAGHMFRELKTKLPPSAHDAVDALEECCERRRQWDRQRKYHFWLHSWLSIHLPLSVALIVLMFVHVFVALKYW